MPQAEGNVEPTTQGTDAGQNTGTETKQPQVDPTVVSDKKVTAPVAGQNNGMSDRERGLLADTQKERQARQKLEAQVKELSTNYARERKRMQLLMSDDPQTEEEQEVATIRAQFAKVFPGLAKLTDEQIEKVLAASEQSGSAKEVVDHHWQTHARRQLDTVVSAIADAAGLDTLSPRQQKKVEALFISNIENDRQLQSRYIAGDPKLVDEFVAEYVEDFVTPAKRQATNAEVNRFRPVPRGGDRNVRNTPAKKVDFSNPQAVEDAMVASYREHGGTFKR